MNGRRTWGARKAGHSSGANSRRAAAASGTRRRTWENPRRKSQASPCPTRPRASRVKVAP